MNKFHVYRLSFKAPLHIGRGKDEYVNGTELPRSDSMLAALCAALYGYDPGFDGCAFLKGVRISSLFPFWGEQLFFPKPYTRARSAKADAIAEQKPKKIKKIRWVQQGAFQLWLAGEEIGADYYYDNALDNGYLANEQSGIGGEKFFRSEIQDRVTLPRLGEADAQPYAIERLHFHKDAGLFFLAQFDDPAQQALLEIGLRLLGHSGLGTDRSVGNGAFTWVPGKENELSFDVPKSGHWTNLGLFCPASPNDLPTDLEAEKGTSRYSLTQRGGWSLTYGSHSNARNWRRKSVYMFEEGAVFCRESAPEGTVHDLKPDGPFPGENEISHPIYRSGRCLWLPIHPIL